jgi:2-phosphoglycerate kinase
MAMTKQIILIGGMPTAGKSTVAENLSKHLNLPWISTDQIGQIMRETATRKKYPKLFTWEGYDGRDYLNKYTADQIVDNEFAKAESVWLGVRKLIKEDYTWNNGFIVEGDDILPHLVVRDFSDSSNVKAVFIGDYDTDRIRRVMFGRDVQENEIEWVLNFGKKLKSQALKFEMPWVEVEKNEHDLAKVLTALGID